MVVVLFLLIFGVSGCGSTADTSAAASQASTSPLVHLPADQAAHTTAPTEWWYVVGHLRQGNRQFGYQATVFKLEHIRPPGLNSEVTIYRTDVAITDQVRHRFHHSIQYFFPGTVSLSTKDLAVRAGTTSLTGSSPQNMRLRTTFGRNAFDLHLASRRPVMNVGGRGYLPFGNGYTYYYSLTDLQSSGSLRVNGVTYDVSGVSWLDHQWGKWSWKTIRGWTWMSLQLNNGVQMSVFDFRSTSGRVKAASVLLSNGQLKTIAGVTIVPTGQWKSPHTGALYPSHWTIRIPALNAVFQVSPTVSDQEMTSQVALKASYWEGSTVVSGSYGGKQVTGSAYTELTGYAGHFATG